jgi:2-dehydro-3-deoxyphosphogluconate aldolase/(4S)-4-hydroxy-2-oxoglutarate aldolase
MVKESLVNAGKFDEIIALCKEAVAKVHNFALAHIGINTANKEEALKTAKIFENLFGFAPRDIKVSVFAGNGVEVMAGGGAGKFGHIAIACNNVERAIALLEKKGVKFRPGTERLDANGRRTFIYIEDEICGFAVHLTQR